MPFQKVRVSSLRPPCRGLPGSIVIAAPEGAAAENSEAIAPREAGLTGQAAGSLTDTLARANRLMDQLTDMSEKSSALLTTANRAVKEADGAITDGKTQGDIRAHADECPRDVRKRGGRGASDGAAAGPN